MTRFKYYLRIALCSSSFFISFVSLAKIAEPSKTVENKTTSTSQAQEAQMSLVISGLSGDLEDNVEARISSLPKVQYQNSFFFRNKVQEEIVKGLNALGYYQAVITFQYDKKNNILTAKVQQGDPIYVKEVDIKVNSLGPIDNAFNDLLNTALSNKGDILDQGKYDSFKSDLEALASSQGYFDAVLTKSKLGISVARHEAFWWIDYNLKRRYQFGEVTFKNSQIRNSYLENIMPFKEGDYYTSEQLALLNYNLSATNWFESITIIPRKSKIERNENSVVLPILVNLEPKKKNQLDLGLGYASDNGPRGSLRWRKPWINDRGHSLDAYTQISHSSKEYSLNYNIPLHSSPIYNYYTIQGLHKKENENDTNSKLYSLGVARNWNNISEWQRSLGINVLYDDFTQADDSFHTFLLYPSASLSKVRSDDSLFPLNASLQRYSAELSSKSVESDIYMFRMQMQQIWVGSLNESNRFYARLNLGIMNANEFDRVPPSFRFFAGGERSIRGYSYQSISPKDKNGQLLGASKLLTGTLEYNHNIGGNWWSAAFIDSGEAVDNFKNDDFHTGAGIGIRWISPVGPIKFDIASPIYDDNNKGLHFYIGLGTDL